MNSGLSTNSLWLYTLYNRVFIYQVGLEDSMVSLSQQLISSIIILNQCGLLLVIAYSMFIRVPKPCLLHKILL